MSDSTKVILQKAYELIENDELEQAQSILTPLLETDADNPTLWWVYAHALRDRAIGQLALDRVIALDSSYPGATELKADVLQLQEQEEAVLNLERDTDGAALSAAGVSVDDWEDLEPVVEADHSNSSGRRSYVLLVVILLIVATGAALVASGAVNLTDLLSGILPSPEPAVIVVSEPTDEAEAAEVMLEASVTSVGEEATALATVESSAEIESSPTVEAAAEVTSAAGTEMPTSEATVLATATAEAPSSPTVEGEASPAAEAEASATGEIEPSPTADEPDTAVEIFVHELAESISEFEIIRESSGIESTLLGDTLVLQVCAIPGREFNERLNRVMNAAVEMIDGLPEDLEAVAAGLLNCPDSNASLRIIGVSVATLQDYAREDINAKEFQRAWQPLS